MNLFTSELKIERNILDQTVRLQMFLFSKFKHFHLPLHLAALFDSILILEEHFEHFYSPRNVFSFQFEDDN
jgi:hypothetical protein